MSLADDIIPSQLDTEFDDLISKIVRTEHEEEAVSHEPSGKLAAGYLGKPLMEQVLKICGVPAKPVDDYALRLFKRGDQVEDWFIEKLKPEEKQKEIEYRGAIGFIDAIKDGRIFEVKSIKNSQVQYIDPNNDKQRRSRETGEMERVYSGPKYANVLQGGLYALAEDADEYTIAYVAADDLRVYAHVIRTLDVKDEIDGIIDEVYTQLKTGKLPAWVEREAWQKKYPDYSYYPEWMFLDPDTAMEKLKRQYPDAYKRLLSFKKGK